jgi:hypothetical protein
MRNGPGCEYRRVTGERQLVHGNGPIRIIFSIISRIVSQISMYQVRFHCDACQIFITARNRRRHEDSNHHRVNIQRRQQNLPPANRQEARGLLVEGNQGRQPLPADNRNGVAAPPQNERNQPNGHVGAVEQGQNGPAREPIPPNNNNGNNRGGGRANKSRKFLLTSHQKCKYYMVRKIKQHSNHFIVCREFERGAMGPKAHLHCYMRTKKKFKLPQLRELLTSMRIQVNDLQAVKNELNAIRYVSKEDRVIFDQGIDFAKLNWTYKIKAMAEKYETIQYQHPLFQLMPVCYNKRFIQYHTDYWKDINTGKCYEDNPTPTRNWVNFLRIFYTRDLGKKGIYIHGETGLQKSLAAMELSHYQAFMCNMNSTRFCLDGYNGEKVIILDELENYQTWRAVLLGLASGLPFKYDVKGETPKVLYTNLLHRVLVTSNEDYPEDPPFRRRYINCKAGLHHADGYEEEQE